MLEFILGIYFGMNLLSVIIYFKDGEEKRELFDIIILLTIGSLFYILR